MIALRKTQTRPIGVHWGPRFATLVQLAGEPGDMEVHALAHGEIPFDDSQSADEHDQTVAAVIKKLVSDHHFKGRQVVCCLGSQELFLQIGRLPLLPPEGVEKGVRWEAEERLPFAIDEAEIRYLTAGKVRQDADIKQEVILLACQQSVIQRHISILEQAGLTPKAIDIEPCAMLRSFCNSNHQTPDDQRHAFLNLGEKATTVIFAEGDKILFLKYVASGGYHLDLAVSKHLDLSLTEAARMRSLVTSSAKLETDNEIHRSVIDAIRDPLDALAAEVELCLRYFKVTFRGKPLDKIIVTGNDASPWLAEFLTNSLANPCELGNPFETLSRWPTSASALERPGRWATAMGLSLK